MYIAGAMGALAFMGAMQQGEQQKQQNALQRIQHEEKEFQRKMQNQIKNRGIAKANAAKWMGGIKIGEAAAKMRGEEEFWLKYNHDNSSGQFSRSVQKANAQITSAIQGKNISVNSGTSRALLRQSLETAKRGMVSKSTNYSNALISAERKQGKMLAQRDFGYSDQVKFMPAQLHQISDSAIMSNALVSGVIAGGSAGISTGIAMEAAGIEGFWS